MSPPPEAIARHLAVLKNQLGDEGLPFYEALAEHNWDVQMALNAIEINYPKIYFAYHVAVIFDDDERFFDILQTQEILDLQILAKRPLQEVIEEGFRPRNCTRDVFYNAAWGKLFELQPCAVVCRELKASNLKTTHPPAPTVIKLIQRQMDWDILNVPAAEIFEDASLKRFLGAHPTSSSRVVMDWLNRLQRTLALTRGHTVEAMSAFLDLMNSEFASAASIALITAKEFVSKFATSKHPEETWFAIHARAVGISNCTMCVVDALYNTARGSGIAVLDGTHTLSDRLSIVSKAGGGALKNINLTELFHDLDSESCDDCNSVTSPAAYFVELLQFLRNNNVQAAHAGLSTAVTNTVLGRLFARRPDLGELELTCSNTTVVLPYLDLANEVMESYVVRQGIDAYDTCASSSEALAEPEVCYFFPFFLVLCSVPADPPYH